LRTFLPILLSASFVILSACEKHADILPKIPLADSSAAAEITKIIDSDTAEVAEASQDTVEAPADTAVVSDDTIKIPGDTIITEALPVSTIDSPVYEYKKNNDLPYRILFPKNYDADKNYPLLLFLHGIGERGSDNEKQLTWGASLFQIDSIRDKYPAIVVFPQCQTSHYWFDNWGTQNLKALTDRLVSDYAVDEEKIYIGGLSMGAYGTYAMVAKFPELFAAAVAISGDGDENKASSMAKIKWRIFAGKKDQVVSSAKSEKMVKALKNSGASVLFTLYPQADHVGSWVNAFAEPDFCSWLFSVSRN
jgi:predicted peptidase